MRDKKLQEFVHIDDETRQDMLYGGELFEEINQEYFKRLMQKDVLQKHWETQKHEAMI